MMPQIQRSFSSGSFAHPFWAMEVSETLGHLGSSPDGISQTEARSRLAAFGRNELSIRHTPTALALAFRQLKSPLILVLIGAGTGTALFREWVDAAVIFAAVTVNSALGFWQEFKAELAIGKLASYTKTRSRVRRDGVVREIDAAEIVPGDIVILSRGDRVPADARIIFASDLEVDEAILTGESLPTAKRDETLLPSAGLAERRSMVYSGTLVVEGAGEVVTTATGERTEIGHIADLLAHTTRPPTPLEHSVRRFVLATGGMLTVLVGALFLLGLRTGYTSFDMFLIAVAVAVSAIPEGLPIALTVILAVGVERLAARRAIVRQLAAAETLGATTIILTDKTGTLTQAKMTVSRIVPAAGIAEQQLLTSALWNCDTLVENPDDPPVRWKISGRPLEVALVQYAGASGVASAPSSAVLERLTFASERRFSATAIRTGGNREFILFGAPDTLLQFSDISPPEHERWMAEIEKLAQSGARVLGLAVRRAGAGETLRRFERSRFSFRGLIAFHDPLRPEVREAIRRIRTAGVKTVIVTGDHKGTAEAVARELGLVDGKGAILTGDDIRALSPEALQARAMETSVFARVTPEQKLEIVNFFRRRGEVVAVTGDGVNDAPALEAADIGVAIGSGSDVTKSAADLVLLDDNYGTIVSAIEEGRTILTNIRKVVVYLLSSVFDALFLIGGSLIAGVPIPLSTLQILFVNFFSDSFPAVAFAFERGIDDAGSRVRKGRAFFDRDVQFLVGVIGTISSVLLLVLYLGLLWIGYPLISAQTFTFAAFASYSLFLAFSVRSLERPIWSFHPFSNHFLTSGVLFGLLMITAVIYIPPLQKIFGTVALSPLEILGVLLVGVANITGIEFGKRFFRIRRG